MVAISTAGAITMEAISEMRLFSPILQLLDCVLEESVLVVSEMEAESCVDKTIVLLDTRFSMIAICNPSGFSVVP